MTLQHALAKYHRWVVVAIVALTAVGGVAAVLVSSAATPFVSLEPELGALSSPAVVKSDASASGGSAVLFAAPSSGGTCTGALHQPDGSDGMGGCWPGANTTGPAVTPTAVYSGATTLTAANAVIDGKVINDDLVIKAAGIQIKNSIMNGRIDADGAGYSITISDSIINAGNQSPPAIGYGNLTVLRSEVTGGQHSILCGGNCVIQDNWLHNQYNAPGGAYHNNAFISNGGSTMTIRHNTLHCTPENNSTGGGCTADASIFGDFAPIKDITFDRNLFMPTPSGAYCGSFGHNPAKPYGNNPTNIVVSNNIFKKGSNGKCGTSAPVTSFMSANGNQWITNTWDDGGVVPAVDD